MHKPNLLAPLLAVAAAAATPARVVIYPTPSGEVLSDDYQLEIDGEPVPVYTAPVNDQHFDGAEYGGNYSFAAFDFAGA